jgi:iron-sulfur cluster repair protein YtfE (RIC family)
MKVTDLLKKDHREVEDLFSQIEEASGSKRAELAATIFDELEIHTTAEEEVFYPAIREAAGDEIVDESVQEHHVVDVLMAELKAIDDVDADEWTAKLTVMKENVEHHVEEEEQEMFPDVEKALGDARLESLGEEVAEFKLRRRLEGKTVDELQVFARDCELDGRSDMDKDALVDALFEVRPAELV